MKFEIILDFILRRVVYKVTKSSFISVVALSICGDT